MKRRFEAIVISDEESSEEIEVIETKKAEIALNIKEPSTKFIDEPIAFGDLITTNNRVFREAVTPENSTDILYFPPLVHKNMLAFFQRYKSDDKLRRIFESNGTDTTPIISPYDHLPAMFMMGMQNSVRNHTYYAFGDTSKGLWSWVFAFCLGIFKIEVIHNDKLITSSWLQYFTEIFVGYQLPTLTIQYKFYFPFQINVVIFDIQGLQSFIAQHNTIPADETNKWGFGTIVFSSERQLIDKNTNKPKVLFDLVNPEATPNEIAKKTYTKEVLVLMEAVSHGFPARQNARRCTMFSRIKKEDFAFKVKEIENYRKSQTNKTSNVFKALQPSYSLLWGFVKQVGTGSDTEIEKRIDDYVNWNPTLAYKNLFEIVNAKMIGKRARDAWVVVTSGYGNVVTGIHMARTKSQYDVPVFVLCTNYFTYVLVKARIHILEHIFQGVDTRIYAILAPRMLFHLQPKPIYSSKGHVFKDVMARIAKKVANATPAGHEFVIRKVMFDKNTVKMEYIKQLLNENSPVDQIVILHDPRYYEIAHEGEAVSHNASLLSAPENIYYDINEDVYTEITTITDFVYNQTKKEESSAKYIVYQNKSLMEGRQDEIVVTQDSILDASSQLSLYSLADPVSDSIVQSIEKSAPETEIQKMIIRLSENIELEEVPFGMITEEVESGVVYPSINEKRNVNLTGNQKILPEEPLSPMDALDNMQNMDEEMAEKDDEVEVVGDPIEIEDNDIKAIDLSSSSIGSEDTVLSDSSDNSITRTDVVKNILMQTYEKRSGNDNSVNVLTESDNELLKQIVSRVFDRNNPNHINSIQILEDTLINTLFVKSNIKVSVDAFKKRLVMSIMKFSDDTQTANTLINNFVSHVVGVINVSKKTVLDIVKIQNESLTKFSLWQITARIIFETMVSVLPDNWKHPKIAIGPKENDFYNATNKFVNDISKTFSNTEKWEPLLYRIYRSGKPIVSEKNWQQNKSVFEKRYKYINKTLLMGTEGKTKLSEMALPPFSRDIVQFIEQFFPPNVARVFTPNSTYEKNGHIRYIKMFKKARGIGEYQYFMFMKYFLVRYATVFQTESTFKQEVKSWFSGKKRAVKINGKKLQADYNLLELANYFVKSGIILASFPILDRNKVNDAESTRAQGLVQVYDWYKKQQKEKKVLKSYEKDIPRINPVKRAKKDILKTTFIANTNSSLESVLNACDDISRISSNDVVQQLSNTSSELDNVQKSITLLNSDISSGKETSSETINIEPSSSSKEEIVVSTGVDLSAVIDAAFTKARKETIEIQQKALEKEALKKQAIAEQALLEDKLQRARMLSFIANAKPEAYPVDLNIKYVPSVLLCNALKNYVDSVDNNRTGPSSQLSSIIFSDEWKETYLKARYGVIDSYFNTLVTYEIRQEAGGRVLYSRHIKEAFAPYPNEGDIDEFTGEIDAEEEKKLREEIDKDEMMQNLALQLEATLEEDIDLEGEEGEEGSQQEEESEELTNEDLEFLDEHEYVTDEESELISTLTKTILTIFVEKLNNHPEAVRVKEMLEELETRRMALQAAESHDTILNHKDLNGLFMQEYQENVPTFRINAVTKKESQDVLEDMLKKYNDYGSSLEVHIANIYAHRKEEMNKQYFPFFSFFGTYQDTAENTPFIFDAVNQSMTQILKNALENEILLFNMNAAIFHPTKPKLCSNAFYTIESDEPVQEEPPKKKKTNTTSNIIFDPDATPIEQYIQIIMQTRKEQKMETAKTMLTSDSGAATPIVPYISNTPADLPEKNDILQGYDLIRKPLTMDNFKLWTDLGLTYDLVEILKRIRDVRQSFDVSMLLTLDIKALKRKANITSMDQIRRYMPNKYAPLIAWYKQMLEKYVILPEGITSADIIEDRFNLPMNRQTVWEFNIAYSKIANINQEVINFSEAMNMTLGKIVKLGQYGGDIFLLVLYYSKKSPEKSVLYKNVYNAANMFARLLDAIDSGYKLNLTPTLEVQNPQWLNIVSGSNVTIKMNSAALILFYHRVIRYAYDTIINIERRDFYAVCEFVWNIVGNNFIGVSDRELLSFMRNVNCNDFETLINKLYEIDPSPFTIKPNKTVSVFEDSTAHFKQKLRDACGLLSPDDNFPNSVNMFDKYSCLIERGFQYIKFSYLLVKAMRQILIISAIGGMDPDTNKPFNITKDNVYKVADVFVKMYATVTASKTYMKEAENFYLKSYEKYNPKFDFSNGDKLLDFKNALILDISAYIKSILAITETTLPDSDVAQLVLNAEKKTTNSTWLSANKTIILDVEESFIDYIQKSTLTIFNPNPNPLLQSSTVKPNPKMILRILSESLDNNYFEPFIAVAKKLYIVQVFANSLVITQDIVNSIEQANNVLLANITNMNIPKKKSVSSPMIYQKTGTIKYTSNASHYWK